MSTQIYPHKRGATLSLAGTVMLPAGVWTGTCQVKQDVDGVLTLVEPLTVTLQAIDPPPAAGQPTHNIAIEGSAAQAADWPVGRLLCDVRFQDESAPPAVITSETFVIKVTQEVTSAPA
jgi:hypothetical protein